MTKQDLKQDLINEILFGMKELDEKQLQHLQMLLYMKMDNYEISMKSTEVAIYEGDINEILFKKFIISKKVNGCTDRTIKHYTKTLKSAFAVIGKSCLEVTSDDIRMYMAKRNLKDNVTATTVNNEWRVISSFYTWLQKEEFLLKNPILKVPQMKAQKKKKKAFTELEIEKMRDVLKDEREKAIFELLLSTGARVSELVNIKLSEISKNQILVHGKGQKDRIVYLNAKAQLALEKYIDKRNDGSEYLFPGGAYCKDAKGSAKTHLWWTEKKNVNEDKQVDMGSVEAMVRRRGKKVGVTAYPHKFRRTCATFALRNGMPIEQVSKMLGHESVETTQIYLDLTEKDLEIAHEKYVR